MLKNISSKNGRALLCIAFSFLLSNASLGAAGTCVHWTQEQDRLLVKGVRIHGVGQWAEVAKWVPGRTGRQCRERWNYYSSPAMNNGLWTEAEERSLIHFYLILGRKWKEIAEHFPDRTDKDCKCHLASLVANRLEIPYQQAYDKISHPKVKFLKNLRKMEEARYGDPATATGAVGPANLRPVRLQAPPPLAPWPAPVQGLAADRDGTPVAVDGAVDLALLSPRLPASRPALRPAHLHIPVQGPAADGYGTPVAVDGAADLALLSPRLPASRPALPPAFLFPMIVQAGAAADGRGAAATGELLAPRVVQARTPANGTPAAATGAVGLANPLPALPFYF